MTYEEYMMTVKTGLTEDQKASNARLDWEIAEAERYNARVKEENRRKMEAHKVWLELHPEWPYKACPGLDIRSPRHVIGIRYVE